MTDERERFEAMLDADPAAWHVRLAYADWLEERGEQDAADGQRWMAENNKHPYDSTEFWAPDRWDWWWGGRRVYTPSGHDDLPLPVWSALRQKPHHIFPKVKSFQTRRDAEAALAAALARLAPHSATSPQ